MEWRVPRPKPPARRLLPRPREPGVQAGGGPKNRPPVPQRRACSPKKVLFENKEPRGALATRACPTCELCCSSNALLGSGFHTNISLAVFYSVGILDSGSTRNTLLAVCQNISLGENRESQSQEEFAEQNWRYGVESASTPQCLPFRSQGAESPSVGAEGSPGRVCGLHVHLQSLRLHTPYFPKRLGSSFPNELCGEAIKCH